MWLVIFGLLLIAVTLLRNIRHVPVLSMEIPSQGRTICDLAGNPVVILAPQIVGTPEEHFVRLHEFVHVRQLSDNCGRAMSRFQYDKSFRISQELEAYCAELAERVKYGMNADLLMHNIRLIFDRIYEADTTKINCGGDNGNPIAPP